MPCDQWLHMRTHCNKAYFPFMKHIVPLYGTMPRSVTLFMQSSFCLHDLFNYALKRLLTQGSYQEYEVSCLILGQQVKATK